MIDIVDSTHQTPQVLTIFRIAESLVRQGSPKENRAQRTAEDLGVVTRDVSAVVGFHLSHSHFAASTDKDRRQDQLSRSRSAGQTETRRDKTRQDKTRH